MRRLPLLLAPFLLLTAAPAMADVAIGVEAGAIVMAPQVDPDTRVGYGVAGRFGWVIDLEVLNIIPEVKVAYERPPLDPQSRGQINYLRPTGGVRLSFGVSVFAVILFGHLGYGIPLGAPDEVSGGLNYEIGGGVDFTSIPIIDIGIWGAFNQIRRTGDAYQWASLGLQATLTF